jgi:hypothetical protein
MAPVAEPAAEMVAPVTSMLMRPAELVPDMMMPMAMPAAEKPAAAGEAIPDTAAKGMIVLSWLRCPL